MLHPNGFYERESGLGQHLYISHSEYNTCLPHFHNSIEILFCFRDGFHVTVNGEEYILKRGDMAFINSLDIHHYAEQKLSTFVLVVGGDYYSRFQQFAGGKTFSTILPAQPEAVGELVPLIDSFSAGWSRANELIKYGFVDMFFGTLAKYYPLIEPKSRTNTHIITEILYDIEENLTQSLTLESLAQKYGYSKTYLSSLFNEYLGTHFRDYVNRLRIELAVQYLSQKDKNRDTVLDISSKCGFDSLNTFYRALRKFGPKDRNF